MVGEILKKRREELGLNLREIADDLKIRYDYLHAIEEGDLGKIPAEVYIKGYIQEYAKALHMDPKILIDTYAQQKSTQPEKNEPTRPDSVPGRRFRPAYLLVAAFVIVSAVVIMWLISPDNRKESVSPVSKPAAVTTPAPKEAVATAPMSKPAAGAKNDVPSTRPGPELVLKILATDTTWILAVIDKTHSKEVLMKPGESVTWHADKDFSLKIGNAGGVRLVFNGKEIGKLGEKGQVVTINLPKDET